MQKLAGGEGEIDVARAAVKDGVNMTLSSQATSSLEDVIEVRDQEVKRRRRGNENENDRAVDGEKDLGDGFDVPGFWMQLYMTADPEKSVPLVKRAEGKVDYDFVENISFPSHSLPSFHNPYP